MKPKTHIARTSSSRPSGGFFIPAIFPGEIRAELTEVNKPVLNSSNTINYNGVIFPAVKHGDAPVNKINTVLAKISPLKSHNSQLSTHGLRLPITLLTYYLINPINKLPNCRPDSYRDVKLPAFGATFCPLFAAGKAFAITFADDFQKKA